MDNVQKMSTPLHALQIPDCDNAYAKFQLVAGEDWTLASGLEEGITQAARVSSGESDMRCSHNPF